jgi:putative DNA primase/helicase
LQQSLLVQRIFTMAYYERIFESADQNAEPLIGELCANVEINGNEIDVISENRKDENHGAVKYNTTKNIWANFAGDETGKGVISFLAHVKGISISEAIKLVARTLRIKPTKGSKEIAQKKKQYASTSKSAAENWTPIIPIPNDAPPSPEEHFKLGKSDVEYNYLNENGNLKYKIRRFEEIEGKRKKVFIPLTYSINTSGRKMWRDGFGNLKTRSLFGLELLSNNSNKKILIVEGEKTCIAARALFKEKYLVVTWHGGCQSVNKTDWTPLSKKQVVIWPDYDEPGYTAAKKLSEILIALECDVKIVDLPNSEKYRAKDESQKF